MCELCGVLGEEQESGSRPAVLEEDCSEGLQSLQSPELVTLTSSPTGELLCVLYSLSMAAALLAMREGFAWGESSSCGIIKLLSPLLDVLG